MTYSIRRIVIPVRGDGKGDNVFAHAAALARRFSAHVVITHCRARAEDMMPFGVPIPAVMKELILNQTKEVADQTEAGLRKEVEALASEFAVTLTEQLPVKSGVGASASWIEEQGRQVDIIKRHGRLADIICVAKPDVDRNLGANTLKSALFHTGRPVMMCPQAASPPQVLCDQLAIAWNGSIEASRAVAMNIGLIEQAGKVTILTSGTELNGASTEQLANSLAQREVNASVVRIKATKNIGAHLLEYSNTCEADTLIMGAYGDSHERETIFGGNTQYVVDHAEMPVIFVH